MTVLTFSLTLIMIQVVCNSTNMRWDNRLYNKVISWIHSHHPQFLTRITRVHSHLLGLLSSSNSNIPITSLTWAPQPTIIIWEATQEKLLMLLLNKMATIILKFNHTMKLERLLTSQVNFFNSTITASSLQLEVEISWIHQSHTTIKC